MRSKRISHPSLDSQDEGQMNLTPLIDVVFVVLIMFILIAPMLEIDKVHLASGPTQESPDAITPSELMIQVREDNSIWINKHAINAQNLKPLLVAVRQKNPKLIPQLYQDEKAYFGTYQMVKNSLEEAGFSELDIVLKNETN